MTLKFKKKILLKKEKILNTIHITCNLQKGLRKKVTIQLPKR